MPSTDHYKVLNVPSDADVDTIQKAFRDLSLQLHPDKANASTIPRSGVETKTEREAREQRNHERFVKIVKARDTLIDPAKRREYDRERRRAKQPSTHEASKSGAASRPDKKTRPQSTTHQETSADFDRANNASIRRLERLDLDFNRIQLAFCGTRPRSESSSSYPVYLEILQLFSRAVFTNERIMDSVRETRESLRSRSSKARAAYEPAMAEANTHIPRAQALVSDLDALLSQSSLDLPRNLLYDELMARLTTFLFP